MPRPLSKPLEPLSKSLFVLFAFVSASVVLGCNSGQSALAPGVRAPQISLNDLDGKPASIEQYKGKWILLNFWASWCAPCLEELPALEVLNQELSAHGLSVVSVAVEDDPQILKAVVERSKITFPVLLDMPGAVKTSFGVAGLPETFLIDPQGKMAMINDPATLLPGIKITGPRDWSSKSAIALLRRTIGK